MSEPVAIDDSAQRPRVALALIHWRRVSWVVEAVESILRSDVPVAIAVINNSPEDATALEVALGGRASVVTPGQNLGFAGAANIAIERWLSTSIEYGAIASHDLTVRQDTIRLLSEALDADETLGAVGPQVITKLSGAGSIQDSALSSGIVRRDWLPGACLLMRRSCVAEVGGFDEVYGSYVEDRDWCWRASKAGWGIGLVTEAHAEGRGTGDTKAEARLRINSVRFEWRRRRLLPAIREYGRIIAGAGIIASHTLDNKKWNGVEVERARALMRSATDLRRVAARPRIWPSPAHTRLSLQRSSHQLDVCDPGPNHLDWPASVDDPAT